MGSKIALDTEEVINLEESPRHNEKMEKEFKLLMIKVSEASSEGEDEVPDNEAMPTNKFKSWESNNIIENQFKFL